MSESYDINSSIGLSRTKRPITTPAGPHITLLDRDGPPAMWICAWAGAASQNGTTRKRKMPRPAPVGAGLGLSCHR